jgi:hypothetical protein
MARPHIEFVNTEDVQGEALQDGPWFGAFRRILSEDDQTGATTAIYDTHALWDADLSAETGLLEVLVVEGDVIAHGVRVGRGGYVRAEDAAQLQGLQSLGSARLLVLHDPSFEAPGGARPVAVVDTERLPYQHPGLGGPAGITVKMLNADLSRGPLTLLAANVARYGSGPEFHSCPEELYVLGGDVTGRYGTMIEGSYFWRPEFINHGPYWSETGLLCLLRGHGDLYAYWHDDADATPEQNRANLPRFEAERAAKAAGPPRS